MPSFSIMQGASELCTWAVETGKAVFHHNATRREEMLILEETKRLSLALVPGEDGLTYRLFIGDIPLSDLLSGTEDAEGIVVPGQILWRQYPYFESARGITKIMIEARVEDAENDKWGMFFATEVYVLPSKIGETHYQGMATDLQNLSRSLLVDLYGKSKQTHDMRFSREGRAYITREQELRLIVSALDQLAELLTAIAQRPASLISLLPSRQKYWGESNLHPLAINELSRLGCSPLKERQPVSVRTWRKVETFDIPEHRVVKAFLEILIRRAQYCLNAARYHITAINSEKYLRHTRITNGPTLYESVDLPKIRRLQNAIVVADRCIFQAAALSDLPFLRGIRPQLVALSGGSFQRTQAYHFLLSVIRNFLVANAVWYEGTEMSEVTKLTSRLFEQWCFMRVVEAFRKSGLEFREWNETLRLNLHDRFILDFNRGLLFEGELGKDMRIRLRYEPWILGKQSATQAGETLCRGSVTDVAWCPDIVIECMRHDGSGWRPIYCIVMDCKYTAHLQEHHWNDTSKYLQIRDTKAQRQIVKQLWLIAPNTTPSIDCEDPAVHFTDAGPSCAHDEAVRLSLRVLPTTENTDDIQKTDGDANPFNRFAQGTIRYLEREFVSSQ